MLGVNQTWPWKKNGRDRKKVEGEDFPNTKGLPAAEYTVCLFHEVLAIKLKNGRFQKSHGQL